MQMMQTPSNWAEALWGQNKELCMEQVGLEAKWKVHKSVFLIKVLMAKYFSPS